jgi:hypothetical protein
VRAADGRCPSCGKPGAYVYFVRDDGVRLTHPERCLSCRATAGLREAGDAAGGYVLIQSDADRLAAERARFVAMFPSIGPVILDALGGALDTAAGPPPRFPVGNRYRIARCDPFLESTFVDAIASHAAGDFGAHGHLDAVALDDDARWAPELSHSVAVLNAVSVEAGSGVVRSRFAAPERYEPGWFVEAATLLDGGGGVTYARNVRADAPAW